MTHPVWPLFDLRIRTPRLEIRYTDDELATELALLATRGIHDPATMPFTFPWTDVASPQLERNAMQYYWSRRASLTPEAWDLQFTVLENSTVVGTTALMGSNFATMRQFETGSWLGREFQGRGIGKEMRVASLQLGFAGLGAQWAVTAAYEDNAASRGVTERLGYTRTGTRRALRRTKPGTTVHYEMSRDHWTANLRRDDIELVGVEACLALLGLEPSPYGSTP